MATLQATGLTVGDELKDVSFTAHPGRSSASRGWRRSGVATLLGVLFGTGIHPRERCATRTAAATGFPTAAARRGVALVPADRRHQGLMLDRSIVRNVSLVNVGALPARTPWLRPGEMLDAARRQVERLRIKVGHPEDPVGSLSGGNQQKVVIGKWLEVAPRVMLLDDPTRGVDVGAKRELYLLIRALADEGRIVLFRSTELPELVGLADRILVLYRGRLALELAGATTSDHEVLRRHQSGQPLDAAEAVTAQEGSRSAAPSRCACSPVAWPSTGSGMTRSGRRWWRDRAERHRVHDHLRERPGALPLFGDRPTPRPGTGVALKDRDQWAELMNPLMEFRPDGTWTRRRCVRCSTSRTGAGKA